MFYHEQHDYQLYYRDRRSEVIKHIPGVMGYWTKTADAHVVIDLTAKKIIKNRFNSIDEAIKFICSLKSKYVRRIFKQRYL